MTVPADHSDRSSVAEHNRLQVARMMDSAPRGSVRLQYLVYHPSSYECDQDRWPLILFLHGAGERGSDVWDVTRMGLPRLLEQRSDFPCVVVSPQCPPNEYWSPELLTHLLDEVESQQRVDRERVYVTGLSMGGYGTWSLAIAQPDRFAAIAPVCGGGQPEQAYRISHLPVWTFHGARDDIVQLQRTREMVEALLAAGGNVKFTIYPKAGHDSWTQTYENPNLYEWFLRHTRRPGV